MNSTSVVQCQCCGEVLEPLFFAGYLPPVNTFRSWHEQPTEQPFFPAQLLKCDNCQLVQLGCAVDPSIVFPPNYAYRSGCTKLLMDNFREQAYEANLLGITTNGDKDLVVDIGSNDGSLLNRYKEYNCRVLGIEPTNAAEVAFCNDVPTLKTSLHLGVLTLVEEQFGWRTPKANLVTACNVFAHIPNPNYAMVCVKEMLAKDGVFLTESHYLPSLLETLQYDTIYHEHLRYYSLTSLKYLLESHDMEIFHAKKIPTHGGSIRVYAQRRGGKYAVREDVTKLLNAEKDYLSENNIEHFVNSVVRSKLNLLALLNTIKERFESVCAVGCPSRAVTMIHYCGLDEGMIDFVAEVAGSKKIGCNVPGTLIPVYDEQMILKTEPDYALILAWHIADELMAKLRDRGFKGKFIIPLPEAKVVS